MLSVTGEDDSSPPVVSNCPESSDYTLPFGATSRVVTWTEPTATDDSGMEPTVTQTHQSGDTFPIGSTQVVYTFMDRAGNIAMCSFSITGNSLLLLICWKVYNLTLLHLQTEKVYGLT